MVCPDCKKGKTQCIDSRQEEQWRRRRYKCSCGHRFTTIEIYGDCKQGVPLIPGFLAQWQNDFLDHIEGQLAQTLIDQRREIAGG